MAHRMVASHPDMRELSASEVGDFEESFATGDTSTSSGGISNHQGEEWLTRILNDAEPLRHFMTIAREIRSLVGTGDDTVHIPKTTGTQDISTSGTSEGAARSYTVLDKTTDVDVTVSGDNWKKGGIAISKEAVQTSTVDLIAQARYHVAQKIAQEADEDIRATAVSGASNNVDQSSSGVFTPDAFADAMENIEKNNFVPQWAVIAPQHQTDLRKDSQFTNAAEYGRDVVLRTGEIGDYLGVRVLKSTNITNDANNKAVMAGKRRDGVLMGVAHVWKELPNVAMEFDQEQSEHRIFLNQAYENATINGDSLATIQTA